MLDNWEDLFEIQSVQKGLYDKNIGKDFITWETVLKKRPSKIIQQTPKSGAADRNVRNVKLNEINR